MPSYPAKVFFYCDVPAPAGGQTPILQSHVVCERLTELHPEIMQRLEEEGIVYTRVLPEEDDPTSPIGRGWKSTFQTTDKAVAEEKAQGLGVSLVWQPDGTVKSISCVLPGVKPYRGRKQFFNSLIAAYTGWKDSRNDPTRAVTFANGDLLEEQFVKDATRIMDEECCDWKWEAGDVLMIDNEQVMHARRSFVPPRRILAALFK